jgi:hypothetical protein
MITLSADAVSKPNMLVSPRTLDNPVAMLCEYRENLSEVQEKMLTQGQDDIAAIAKLYRLPGGQSGQSKSKGT